MDGLMMDYPLTVPQLLDRAARYFPDVEVVSRRPDQSLARSSYSEVRCRAHQLAGALARLGVGRGDRVATLGWNNARHLEAYFGVPLMGGVLHTLNPRLSAEDLAYIVNHAGDSVLLVDEVLLPVLERLRGQVSLKHVVVWANGTQAPEGMIDYEELIAAEPGEFAGPRLDEREAAAMCYTSGTTGRPKGVVYSHRAIVLHSLASAMADGLAIGQREVLCPVVPMFHVNGWGLPFTATMVGCKQVLPGPAPGPGEPARPVRSGGRHAQRRRADDLAGHFAGAGEGAGPLEARRDPDGGRRVGGAGKHDPRTSTGMACGSFMPGG